MWQAPQMLWRTQLKKRAKSEQEERGKKKRKRATTVTDRIEGVLEQLPQFLATANSEIGCVGSFLLLEEFKMYLS